MNSKRIEITAYHGTNSEIESFDRPAYFTTEKDVAEGYAIGKVKIHKKGQANIYSMSLVFNNPIYYESLQRMGSLVQEDIENLKKEGYDGAVYLGTVKEPIPEYLPFYPEVHLLIDKEVKEVILMKKKKF